MKTRIIFWILATPFLCLSSLLLLLFLISISSASDAAEKNQRQRAALLKRVEIVESFLKSTGQFPSPADFTKASTEANDGSTRMYDLYTSRPDSSDFRFPEWPEGKPNFAIGYWRSDWFEFYDSHSRTSTLDEKSKLLFWVKDALVPLAGSAIFALPPLLLFWIWKKMQSKKLLSS
jgi:hypothetical protein